MLILRIHLIFLCTLMVSKLVLADLDSFGEGVCRLYDKEKIKTICKLWSDDSDCKLANKNVKVCCDSYFQYGDKCLKKEMIDKICSNCLNGECVIMKNETHYEFKCDCQVNFRGHNCDQTCPPNTFGNDCEFDCNCLTDQHCNKNYKDCSCDTQSQTEECKNICKCRTNSCRPGFIGENCTIPCPENHYGFQCRKACKCIKENTKKCNIQSGQCECLTGFYGIYCENRCDGQLNCSTLNFCTCDIVLQQKLAHPNQLINNHASSNRYLSAFLYGLLIFLIAIVLLYACALYIHRIRKKRLQRELEATAAKEANFLATHLPPEIWANIQQSQNVQNST